MSKVKHGPRGYFEMSLGGKPRTFRYRAHELAMLEKRTGKGIISLLDEGNLGISFLRDAIIVGVAHEFIGRRGKQREVLTEELVCKWIDESEEVDGITFEELLEIILTGVVSGVPGKSAVVNQLKSDEDEKPAEESGDKGNEVEAGKTLLADLS